MADYDLPEDLIALKRDFLTADAECHEIAKGLPSTVAVLAGEVEPDPDGQERLDVARGRRLEVVRRIYAHEWWGTVDNRHSADKALLKAAKDALASSEGDAVG